MTAFVQVVRKSAHKTDAKSYLPNSVASALDKGWNVALNDNVSDKKSTDPIKVVATAPGGNMTRHFEIVLGATPFMTSVAEALAAGWSVEPAGEIAVKHRDELIEIRATAPDGEMSQQFKLLVGMTPFCPMHLLPPALIFEQATLERMRMRLASWAVKETNPDAEVLVFIDKGDGEELRIRAPLGETPFGHRLEKVRVGKTERDHESKTRGKHRTGHSAILGPKKGVNPPAWNGTQGRGNKKKEAVAARK